MPITLPYLSSNKNVEKLFQKISAAKIPDKFTHGFLQSSIGLKGTNDRPLIPLLRTLGFIDQSGTPTATYRQLKNRDAAKLTLAAAIRSAYAPLFEADEQAHTLSGDKLKGLVAQVAGTDEDMTARIVATFSALVKLADFAIIKPVDEELVEDPDLEKANGPIDVSQDHKSEKLHPEFHYNIQVHLPSNATEDVYLNIFNALRRAFK